HGLLSRQESMAGLLRLNLNPNILTAALPVKNLRRKPVSGGRKLRRIGRGRGERPSWPWICGTAGPQREAERVARAPLRVAAKPSLALRLREALGDGVPVDDVPPRIEVFVAAVLVAQVVGVLPDVHAQDGDLALHQRAVLVQRALNGQLLV